MMVDMSNERVAMRKGDTFTYDGQTATVLWIAEGDGSRQRPVRFQTADGTVRQADAANI